MLAKEENFLYGVFPFFLQALAASSCWDRTQKWPEYMVKTFLCGVNSTFQAHGPPLTLYQSSAIYAPTSTLLRGWSTSPPLRHSHSGLPFTSFQESFPFYLSFCWSTASLEHEQGGERGGPLGAAVLSMREEERGAREQKSERKMALR